MRLATGAVALGLSVGFARSALAVEVNFTGTASNYWYYLGNWQGSHEPAAGDVADVFYSSQQVNYNVSGSSVVDLKAVQISGPTNSSTATLSFLGSGTFLQTMGLYIGAGETGLNGTQSSAGPGKVTQSVGEVEMDPNSVLAVDPLSSYTFSGGTLIGNN